MLLPHMLPKPKPIFSNAAFVSRFHTKDGFPIDAEHRSPSTSALAVVPLEDLPSTASRLQPSSYASEPLVTLSMGNGAINWQNPGEVIVGGITLLYIIFSIAAGIKYVIKDGWRPKL